MDNDRAFVGRLRDEGAHPLASIVVLTLTAVVGIGLITHEGDAVAPAPSSVVSQTALAVASSTAAQTPSPRPRIAAASTFSPSRFAGLIGLPPEGATPSEPRVGELVDTWWVGDRHPPYVGAAQLYADGRLIWNRYFNSPEGQNSRSTGHIEQRLTPEGVALVLAQKDRAAKNPWRLPDWLTLDAWEDRTPRPYVASGYGICPNLVNRRSDSPPGPTIEPSQLIEMLPASVSKLLRDAESLWAPDYGIDCVAQTTEEARVLDRALRDAGLDQEAFINRFLLQYSVDVPGASGIEIWLMFEPRFPDGSIGCSACG